jgi:hypothetical protein
MKLGKDCCPPILLYWALRSIHKYLQLWIWYAIKFCFSVKFFRTAHHVGVFEVLTAVVMKSSVFWDITPRSPLKVNRRFGEAYRLHIQSSACHLISRWFLARLILLPWRWRRHVPPKRWLTFNELNGVISQKIVLFTAHHVRRFHFCLLGWH